MFPSVSSPLAETIRQQAHPGDLADDSALLRFIGDARIVLLGAATLGTAEFFHAWTHLTQKLIDKAGFDAIAIVASAPIAMHFNREIHDERPPRADRALRTELEKFPGWLWSNKELYDFLVWLYAFNATQAARTQRVSFYSLDPLSFSDLADDTMGFLHHEDPSLAARARAYFTAWEQLERFAEQPPILSLSRRLQDKLMDHLLARYYQRMSSLLQHTSAEVSRDILFTMTQYQETAQDAHGYARLFFADPTTAWNAREHQMAGNLETILRHLRQWTPHGRVVVWSHNLHIGDMRATHWTDYGLTSLGQILREQLGSEVVSIGFLTHHGTVTAARQWGDIGSGVPLDAPTTGVCYGDVLHGTNLSPFWLPLRGNKRLHQEFSAAYLEQAIGSVFRTSHPALLAAHLADQFDAIAFWDETHQITPLEVHY